MSFVVVPKPQRSPLPYQIITVLVGSLVLFFLGVLLLTGGYAAVYSGHILPGVSVAGFDLSNMSPQQASVVLSQHLTYPTAGKIVFREGNQAWVAAPAELGMVYDIGASVQDAYRIGRSGGEFFSLAGLLNARMGGMNLPLVVIIDQRVAYSYLQNLASKIDHPAVEADLHLEGTTVVYTPGQSGRRLNVDATMAILVAQLKSIQDGTIPLDVEVQNPQIQEAASTAEVLGQILSTPLILSVPNAQAGDPQPWSIDPSTLSTMVSVQKVNQESKWQYQVSVNSQPLQQLLDRIANQVNRTPQNARFIFNDNTHQLAVLQPSVSGRILDEQATLQAIQEGLLHGEHNISLQLTLAPAQAGDNATAASLEITDLVSEQSSYFRYSSPDRVQNIIAASARFQGLLVPPHTTFSMADALGDISLDNGYAEAPIIDNGRTILGVGGGVCQVSTTLFRTAFFGGYPIVERHPHAYEVSYYEQAAVGVDPNLAGLDATVYVPLVDLKFTNDRSSWLLMEVTVDPSLSKIDWKFYSKDDGRKVNVQPPVITNVTPPPPPLFEESSDLVTGAVVQAQSSAKGADVNVIRTVYLNGAMLFSDSVQTQYQPWQAVCQYGPGTQDPQAIAAQRGWCQP